MIKGEEKYPFMSADIYSYMEDSLHEEEIASGEINENEYVENDHLCFYKITKLLGTGSSSIVVHGVNTIDHEEVAIKIIKRKTRDKFDKSDRRIFKEILMSSMIDHPHIVKLKNFMYSRKYYFLIFDYVHGRQLYDVIVTEGFTPEEEARRYFRQILSAINYIHSNGIVHRDLKIENILLDEYENIKIIDFGLSNYFDKRNLLNTFCGSLYFAAPELLQGNRYIGPEIDIWSLGVILFVLLNGKVPFDDTEIINIQEKIKSGNFEFTKNISYAAQELIEGMLCPNIAERYTLSDVMDSIWVNQGYEIPINSYLHSKQPLKFINKSALRFLSKVAKFHFKNLEREVLKYFNICINEAGNLDKEYWHSRPVISMYYMLIDQLKQDISSDESITDLIMSIEDDNITSDISFSDDNEMYLNTLHLFVNILRNNSSNKFSNKSIFKDQILNESRVGRHPIIRNTYLKGFFKGIKVRNIGSHNGMKKMLLDLFIKHNINYKITDKYYICDVQYNMNSFLSFKISIYYNVILGEYYLNLSHITGERKEFRKYFDLLTEHLNAERAL